jgi:hypothetical protein
MRDSRALEVIVGLGLIAVGIPLAMSMLFLFLGAPMVMAGVELLISPSR